MSFSPEFALSQNLLGLSLILVEFAHCISCIPRKQRIVHYTEGCCWTCCCGANRIVAAEQLMMPTALQCWIWQYLHILCRVTLLCGA